MADAYLTAAQVAHFNKTDMDLLVSDVLNQAPVLAALSARTVRGNSFVYTRQTAAPAVGFRAVNDGVENKKSTYEKKTISLGVLDASFGVDVAAAQVDERGWEHIMGIEAMSHLSQAMSEFEQQILNGTVGNVATDAFDGFADQTNLKAGGSMLVDAGGTTASTGSSVYLIRSGEGDVQALFGQEGEIAIGDLQVLERAGSATGRFPAYYHSITGWSGVTIGSSYSVARVANLTADSGKGCTDALLYEALEKFPASRPPNLIAMSRRSLRQLQNSRTSYNPIGTPSLLPSELEGIPIITTDSISNTETLL
jgi:hypothetical protein